MVRRELCGHPDRDDGYRQLRELLIAHIPRHRDENGIGYWIAAERAGLNLERSQYDARLAELVNGGWLEPVPWDGIGLCKRFRGRVAAAERAPITGKLGVLRRLSAKATELAPAMKADPTVPFPRMAKRGQRG